MDFLANVKRSTIYSLSDLEFTKKNTTLKS